jgi:hypothetical protein
MTQPSLSGKIARPLALVEAAGIEAASLWGASLWLSPCVKIARGHEDA